MKYNKILGTFSITGYTPFSLVTLLNFNENFYDSKFFAALKMTECLKYVPK